VLTMFPSSPSTMTVMPPGMKSFKFAFVPSGRVKFLL
jgi:hypothetical protein